MTTTILYDLQGVSKTYGKRRELVPALRAVNLQVRSGDFLTITGAIGSGKTTLLNILAGIDSPTVGSITYAGRPLPTKPRQLTATMRATTGFVPAGDSLLQNFTVIENVTTRLAQLRLDRAARDKRAGDALRRVQLLAQAQDKPDQLSLVERYRAAIACALGCNPTVLLMDEPTLGLDDAGRNTITALLLDLWQQGLTLIVATEDSDLAGQGSFQVRLEQGEIIDQARALELDEVLAILAAEDADLA